MRFPSCLLSIIFFFSILQASYQDPCKIEGVKPSDAEISGWIHELHDNHGSERVDFFLNSSLEPFCDSPFPDSERMQGSTREQEITIFSNDNHSADCNGGYFKVGDGTTNFSSISGTISMWLNFRSIGGHFWGQHNNFQVRISGNDIILDWGSNSVLQYSTNMTITNKWFFWAVTWNENAQEILVYEGDENNSPILRASKPNWTSNVSSKAVIENNIMNSRGGLDQVDGYIDDFRYYNIARSTSAIQSDYKNGLTGLESNLVHYYKFENDLIDSAGSEDLMAIGNCSFCVDTPISPILPDLIPPIVDDYGIDDPGNGTLVFWGRVSDNSSGVSNVTLKFNETVEPMMLNGTGFWVYPTSMLDYGSLISYQISNASDLAGNNLLEPTKTKNHSLSFDIVTPKLDCWAYDPYLAAFKANVSDSWGEIDSVIVNVTYMGGSRRSDLWAVMRSTTSGYINDTIKMKAGIAWFMFLVNDTAGNSFASNEYPYLVPNNAPTVDNLTLSRDPSLSLLPILSNSTLYLSYEFHDLDGDMESTATEFRWYKNGKLQSAYNDTKQIPAFELIRGDKWHATVKPHDGQNFGELKATHTVTIKNTAPQVTDCCFISQTYPEFLIEDENIEISYATTDVDGDNDFSTIFWYRNAEHLSDLDNMTLIPAKRTQAGEVWFFEIVPFDGFQNGPIVRSMNLTIESRPKIQDCGFTAISDYEGHYKLWVKVNDPRNPIIEVQMSVFSETLWAENNGSHWIYDYQFDLALLYTNATIKITAWSLVNQTIAIPAVTFLSVEIQDRAPPRVLNVLYYWDDNPITISFSAEIEELGSGIAAVVLYYYFRSVGEGEMNAAAFRTSENLQLSPMVFPVGTPSEEIPSNFRNATMGALNTTHWGVGVPFNPVSNVEIIFMISVSDIAGNSNPNAYLPGLSPTGRKSFTIQKTEKQEQSLDFLYVAGLFVLIISVLAIVSAIAISKRSTTELIELDKERVMKNISAIAEGDAKRALDSHTLGIVVAFFDESYGPIPILASPGILNDNYQKLEEISEHAFSVCRLMDQFDDEISGTFEVSLGPRLRVNCISFGFALKRPQARGGAEHITLNILLHPHVFPLAHQFIDELKEEIHYIHLFMDSETSEKEGLTRLIEALRQRVSSIILSYDDLYSATELIAF